ncbi:MAG: SDR family NAD(P)-dependent oxidoreductase [Weeksellaceae bacterium]
MNKVAIVTGGAMGYKNGGPSIGGATSIRLAKDGYAVVVVDQGEMGKRTVEIIEKNGGKAIFLQLDVTESQNIQTILETTKKTFGGLTCLVNCVARYNEDMHKSVKDIAETEWDQSLKVDLNSYFKMAKYSIPYMLESGGGTIINISSIESFVALPNFSIYSVAKAAVDGLTRSLAVDFAPEIRTNSILPGFVKIANSENERSPAELEKWYANIAKKYPMKRVCEVDEIANVVSFLAGPESSYINGQSIIVDGGMSIANLHEF